MARAPTHEAVVTKVEQANQKLAGCSRCRQAVIRDGCPVSWSILCAVPISISAAARTPEAWRE